MARAVINRDSLPNYAKAIPDRIEVLGFTWGFFENHLLPGPGKYVQVRDEVKTAPSSEVTKYTMAMKRGDQFPPIVTTSDGYIVDGNTRVAAARKAGLRYFPTFVLDVSYDTSVGVQRDQLKALGAAFNVTHGRGMSPAEIENVIISVTKEGDSARDIAKRLHLSESTVSRVQNSIKARKRAERLGVEVTDVLSQSHMKMFGNKSDKLNDDVFAEFFRLTQDANLPYDTTMDIARRLQFLGNDDAKLALLRERRHAYSQVIKAGVRNVPSRAASLRRPLGALARDMNPEDMVEMNSAVAPEYMRMLRTALGNLEKILSAQIQAENARENAQNMEE